MKEITFEKANDILKHLPKGTIILNGFNEEVYYDKKKERFTWEGWDYYNDDMGFNAWYVNSTAFEKVFLKGNKMIFATKVDMLNLAERKKNEKLPFNPSSFTACFYFPFTNLNQLSEL